MKNRIGIRLEDKNQWERRVVLTPTHVAELTPQGVHITVERSPHRAYADQSYENAGAVLADSVASADIILGVKEMPVDYFRSGGAYMFFSHTMKGQPYNMEMLQALVDNKCTLFDYELVTDDESRRLIFFGRFAGLAGMIDTLWTLGMRLRALGHETPFLEVEPTHQYDDLESAKQAIAAVGERIRQEGLPATLAPLVFGITGYGNVSEGAQEILDLLPVVEVEPGELAGFMEKNPELTHSLVKVVFREEHLVEPVDPSRPFDMQEYYDFPERYRSCFHPHLERLSVLVNGIYWDERYPKLADVGHLETLFARDEVPRLVAVGDITCDIDGSLACTVRDTEPGDPIYVYNPATREALSGSEGPGVAVMAIGNLPCELPRESSMTFSEALAPFIVDLAQVDLSGKYEEASLPDPIRRATILWRGEFTPNFEYMQEFLR